MSGSAPVQHNKEKTIGFVTGKFLHYSNYLKIAHGSQISIVWLGINPIIV